MLTIGDAREWATTLAPGSVQAIVTSPPYFGLRDYGTATWEGGDAACDHLGPPKRTQAGFNERYFGKEPQESDKQGELRQHYRGTCGKCGALRVDKQMGLEATPDEFVANLVALFRALRPALRDDGTLWLNLGDSYAAKRPGGQPPPTNTGNRPGYLASATQGIATIPPGLKGKDLIGIPWLVAFALRADGWYLRSDIVWHKPNPMPESVRDRPTRSHEYLFLLSKSARYFYDAEAIAEPAQEWAGQAGTFSRSNGKMTALAVPGQGHASHRAGRDDRVPTTTRNKRSVWTVATQPYPDAHFATFPPELIRPCILAGTSAKGACVACGAPWRRVVQREKPPAEVFTKRNAPTDGLVYSGSHVNGEMRGHGQKLQAWLDAHPAQTVGWEPSCTCGTTETRPCVVADPFLGSGTTAAVAVEEGRAWAGCDLDARAREWTRARLDGRQIRMGLGVA